jgi:hypothetical protein
MFFPTATANLTDLTNCLGSASISANRNNLAAILSTSALFPGVTFNGATPTIYQSFVATDLPDLPQKLSGTTPVPILTISNFVVSASGLALNTVYSFSIAGGSGTVIYRLFANNIQITAPIQLTVPNSTTVFTFDQQLDYIYVPWVTYTLQVTDANGNSNYAIYEL